MKQLALLLVLFLTGCASVPMYEDSCKYLLEPISECREDPEEIKLPTYIQLQRVPPAKDKVARVTDVVSVIEARRVNILEGMWNDNFLSQCAQFPNARHDDMVDCLQMALDMYGKGKRISAFR